MSSVGARILKYSEPQIEAVRQFTAAEGGRSGQSVPALAGAGLAAPQRRLTFVPRVFRGCRRQWRGPGRLHPQTPGVLVRDRVVPLADFQLPISEVSSTGVTPGRGPTAPRRQHRQSLLFGLGMGGYDQAVARLLVAAGWRIWPVPFLFRIVHPRRFLHNIVFLRRSRFRAVALDAGLYGRGLGRRSRRPAVLPPQALARPLGRGRAGGGVWRLGRFPVGGLPDRLRHVRGARRRGPANPLPRLQREVHPPEGDAAEKCIGWAVVLDTQLSGHRQFGNLRLGSLVDFFASPEDAAAVAGAAREVLERRSVDLIVSNQAHAAWLGAARRASCPGRPISC